MRKKIKNCAICNSNKELQFDFLPGCDPVVSRSCFMRMLCKRCYDLSVKLHKQGVIKQRNPDSHHSLFAIVKDAVKKSLGIPTKNMFAPEKTKHKHRFRKTAKARPYKMELPDIWTKAHYRKYLKTGWWRHIRLVKIREQGGKCEVCGRMAKQVHHKHYRTLNNESMEDLMAVCEECHENIHS